MSPSSPEGRTARMLRRPASLHLSPGLWKVLTPLLSMSGPVIVFCGEKRPRAQLSFGRLTWICFSLLMVERDVQKPQSCLGDAENWLHRALLSPRPRPDSSCRRSCRSCRRLDEPTLAGRAELWWCCLYLRAQPDGTGSHWAPAPTDPPPEAQCPAGWLLAPNPMPCSPAPPHAPQGWAGEHHHPLAMP